MRKLLRVLLVAGLWAVFWPQFSPAFELVKKPCCEQGYRIVEEIVYKDVIKKRCVPAPGVQKKVRWVYDCKTEDFCLPKCSCPLHGLNRHHGCDKCASCIECAHPMKRNLLVKRMVVEECPADKCVIEEYVETVPCKVYRKVPCGNACPTAGHASKERSPEAQASRTPADAAEPTAQVDAQRPEPAPVSVEVLPIPPLRAPGAQPIFLQQPTK